MRLSICALQSLFILIAFTSTGRGNEYFNETWTMDDAGCTECAPAPCGEPECSPYCCDWGGCSQTTGDWGGCRTSLAESGITFLGDMTQFYQGVSSGGRDERFRYAGRGDNVV